MIAPAYGMNPINMMLGTTSLFVLANADRPKE
jgi:hypothetical protein